MTQEKWKYTRNEWRRCNTTPETSGKDVKTTLETSGEDVKTTLETSVVFGFNTLHEYSPFDVTYKLTQTMKMFLTAVKIHSKRVEKM